ncbi:MAG: succinate dehydrogenase cytochrome b subunit [Deltaproteobacteria bacterium]|nr:succinate dehydrogenase cytochrome b subunit [Deltaproteobacteria bacterium]
MIRFFLSSIGAKMLAAVTGVMLLVFVIGHMIGNWQVFLGPDQLNNYGIALRVYPLLLWGARGGIILSLLLHVLAVTRLTLINRAVRPQPYAMQQPVKASWASRNMYVSGLMVAFFVLYHLLQFTWRVTNSDYKSFIDYQGRFDIYRMVVAGFSNPLISLTYIIAMLLLGAHLWHGGSSVFQSLGITSGRTRKFFDRVGPALAVIIVLGEIAMPIAVLAGLVSL